MKALSFSIVFNFARLSTALAKALTAYTVKDAYDASWLTFHPGLPSTRGITIDDCANKCAVIRSCQTFVFEQETDMCHFYGGHLTNNNNKPTLVYFRDNFQSKSN